MHEVKSFWFRGYVIIQVPDGVAVFNEDDDESSGSFQYSMEEAESFYIKDDDGVVLKDAKGMWLLIDCEYSSIEGVFETFERAHGKLKRELRHRQKQARKRIAASNLTLSQCQDFLAS